MRPILLAILYACVSGIAHDVAAAFEDCQTDDDNDDEMFLIQRKVEVALAADQAAATKDAHTVAVTNSTATAAAANGTSTAAATNATPTATSANSTAPEATANETAGESAAANSVWVLPWEGLSWDSSKDFGGNLGALWDIHIVTSIVSWLIWVVLGVLILCFLIPSQPEAWQDPEDPQQTFLRHHFACFRRPRICLCACFCPAVQWADTVHLAGFLKVWIGFAVFCACALLNSLTFGGFACMGFFTSCLVIVYRQHLREKLGLKAWSGPNCLFDCLYVCCCPCCAIAQEAQVVRYAYLQGGQVRREVREAPRIFASSFPSSQVGSSRTLGQPVVRMVPYTQGGY